MTTDRYPCLVPPGTVTPKLTGQILSPPESGNSSARTGILSSLLFSRSQKGWARTTTRTFTPILSVGARLFRRQTPPWSEEPIYDHQRVRTTCLKIFSPATEGRQHGASVLGAHRRLHTVSPAQSHLSFAVGWRILVSRRGTWHTGRRRRTSRQRVPLRHRRCEALGRSDQQ